MDTRLRNKKCYVTENSDSLAHLIVQVEQVGVVFSNIGLGVRDQLSDIPAWTERSLNSYFSNKHNLLCSCRISISYSQMKLPWGISCRARTPQPIFSVLYSWSRTLRGEKVENMGVRTDSVFISVVCWKVSEKVTLIRDMSR